MDEDSDLVIEAAPEYRSLPIVPQSYDEKTREFDCVLSTGAAVRRYDWYREMPFDELLSLADGHVRTDRLDAGLPLLMEHGWTKAVNDPLIGRSIGYRFEPNPKATGGRELVVRYRLSDRKEVEAIARDVATGIKRDVSAGYRTHKVERVPGDAEKGTVEQRTAVDWSPFEGSFVMVAADATARTRDEHALVTRSLLDGTGRPISNRCVVVLSSRSLETDPNSEGARAMDPTKVGAKTEAQGGAVTADPPVATLPAPAETKRALAEGTEVERARQAHIGTLQRAHKLDDKIVEEFRAGAIDVPTMNERVLKLLEARQAPVPAPQLSVGDGPRDALRAGVIEALELRAGLRGKEKMTDRANGLAGVPVLRLFEEYLRRSGVEIESPNADWVGKRAFGMIGTSDLPKILENIANKKAQVGYESVGTTWGYIAERVPATDFKQRSTVTDGLGSALQAIGQGGEIKTGVFGEEGEKYAIGGFGIITPFSFQALRNDDLSIISKMPQKYGAMAAALIEQNLWALITNNVTMADGNQLFSVAHKNLVASGADFKLGGASSVDGLGNMRTLLRLQTDPDKNVKISLPMTYLIVPAALETAADRVTQQLVALAAVANVNPFTGLVKLVNPYLDDSSAVVYYGAVSPAMRPVFEVGFLDGREVPLIDTDQGFEVDGMRFRCRLYFGGVVQNFRGIVKNPGAT